MTKLSKRKTSIIRFVISCIIVATLLIIAMTYFLYTVPVTAYAPDNTNPTLNSNNKVYNLYNSIQTTYPQDITETTVPTDNMPDEQVDADDKEVAIIPEETIPDVEEDNNQNNTGKEEHVENSEFKDNLPEYKYGVRVPPAVDIGIPTGTDMRNHTESVDTSEYKLLGSMKITGYTPGCVHCCGNDKGITASGTKAISGYTVATCDDIPFGTTLYIEGYGYYVVEDRGVGPGVIDIAASSHELCYPLTADEINVYIVPHK